MPDSFGMRNQWIADRLEELGKSKAGLADAVGLPRPRITDILRGDRAVKASEIPPMARYLELDPGYVLLRVTSKEVLEPVELPFIQLEIRGAVQAGLWAPAIEWPPDEWEVVAVPRPDGHRRYFGLKVKGPSMNLVYPEGTILVCVPMAEYHHALGDGDHVIVQRRDNASDMVEGTVKEIRRDDAGRAWLWPRSDHPEHQAPIELPQRLPGFHDFAGSRDVEIVAVVVADYRIRRPAAQR